MADVFGDLDLFSEFDKDREAQGSFIHYDEDNVKSRIIFEDYESENEEESDEETELASTKESPEADKKEQEPATESEENGKEESTDSKDKTADVEIKAEPVDEVKSDGDAGGNRASGGASSKKDAKLSAEDERKVAWLNAQLHAEAAEEANKKNTSSQQLIYERNKFQRFAKVLDSTRYTPDEESPAVQLLFNNNSFARKHRQQIEQFIKGLLWEEFRSPKDTLSEVTVKPGHPSCVDINKDLTPDQRSENMRQKHALIGNSQFHKQFLIDFLGWPFNVAEPTRCNINWEIPLYGQIFNEVYSQISTKAANQSSKPSKPKPSCWNCSELNHSVMDCKVPRNPARIAASRKEFLANQTKPSGPKFSGPKRYHLDPEIASKFSKFKPGTISNALQQALGLNSDQLPQHIYKMRLYGYPPGWLAEAKQVHSGVNIFDKNGRVALITGEHLEDGELDDEEKEAAATEYDVNRIIEYAGFTVPVPLGIQDEHTAFKMPPIQQHQLKKTLMSQSSDKGTSKKRKRAKDEEEKEETKKMKKDDTNGETEEEKAEKTEDAPEVEEGEETQKLAAVDEVTTPHIERSSSTKSMSMDFGTPIFTREKSDLPDASLFGKDIEEHIPFENLPNSVGTFDKMKDLIELIRNKNKK